MVLMMTYYGQSVHLLSIIKQIIPRKSFFTKEQKHGLEEAGEEGRRDTGGSEATANKVTNSQEGITTQKEKVTSASSAPQNQTPAERMTTTTTTTSEVPHYQYQQHQQQQQREQQQSLNRAL